jgi:hypothetical protein
MNNKLERIGEGSGYNAVKYIFFSVFAWKHRGNPRKS